VVKTKSKRKRSASVIVDYAPRGAQSHMQKAPRGVIAATVQRRQTVGDFITSFVGLDVHKDSIAMAVAEAGRDEPRSYPFFGRGVDAHSCQRSPETARAAYRN